jgi:hypothetical protein
MRPHEPGYEFRLGYVLQRLPIAVMPTLCVDVCVLPTGGQFQSAAAAYGRAAGPGAGEFKHWPWDAEYVYRVGRIVQSLARTARVWKYRNDPVAARLVDDCARAVAASAQPLGARLWLTRVLYDQLPETQPPAALSDAAADPVPVPAGAAPTTGDAELDGWLAASALEMARDVPAPSPPALAWGRTGKAVFARPAAPPDADPYHTAQWYIRVALWLARFAIPLAVVADPPGSEQALVARMQLLRTDYEEWLTRSWVVPACLAIHEFEFKAARAPAEVAVDVGKLAASFGTQSTLADAGLVYAVARFPRTDASRAAMNAFVDAVHDAGRRCHLGRYDTLAQLARTTALFLRLVERAWARSGLARALYA